jgi:hypothetical protein
LVFHCHLLHLHWQHQHLQLLQQCWGYQKVVQMERGHCCLPVHHPAPKVLVVLGDLLSIQACLLQICTSENHQKCLSLYSSNIMPVEAVTSPKISSLYPAWLDIRP